MTSRQLTQSFWERVVQPVVFGLLDQWFPLARVNDPTSLVAAANGIFILVTRETYDAVGGHRAIRGEVLEDVALTRAVKRSGRAAVAATLLVLAVEAPFRARRGYAPAWSLTLPLGAALVIAFLLESAARAWLGLGVRWKDRVYSTGGGPSPPPAALPAEPGRSLSSDRIDD